MGTGDPSHQTEVDGHYSWPGYTLKEAVNAADHIVHGRVKEKKVLVERQDLSKTAIVENDLEIEIIRVIKESQSLSKDAESMIYHEIPSPTGEDRSDIPLNLGVGQEVILFLNPHSRVLGPDYVILVTRPLRPLNENAEELAYLVDFDNRNYGCCFSVYTNKLGGRIAVSSFDTWQHLGTAAKRTQILSVMDWLSGNRLPVLVESMIRVAPFVRMNEQRTKFLIALFNTSFDDTGEITIKVRAEASRMWQLSSEGRKEIELQLVDDEIILQVSDIRGWHTVLL